MTRPRWNLWGKRGANGKRGSEIDGRMVVQNVTRGTILASNLEVANTGSKRNKGLLGRQGLSAGEGLWIVPCESVHTFFMQFAIDLVYLDRKNRIAKMRSNVVPWRVSVCLSARSILELPLGTIQATESRKGDRIEFKAAATRTELAAQSEAMDEGPLGVS